MIANPVRCSSDNRELRREIVGGEGAKDEEGVLNADVEGDDAWAGDSEKWGIWKHGELRDGESGKDGMGVEYMVANSMASSFGCTERAGGRASVETTD